ncbi:MAG: Maf family protein [Alphaproteobacteria bacterium]|nr:Maf family protein [Alphaproteobacteria bacterium]
MSPLVLASASASRQSLLRAAGVDFMVAPADIDEPALMRGLIAGGGDGRAVAEALAGEKAAQISRRKPGQTVLGGDSVLELDGEILGKSRDLDALRALLLRMAGRPHRLISAAALARDGRVLWRHTSVAEMTVRLLSEAFIDAYLAREGEKLLSSVGGYHFEGFGAQLFEKAEGDYFSILGLPLLEVLAALRAQGLLET